MLVWATLCDPMQNAGNAGMFDCMASATGGIWRQPHPHRTFVLLLQGVPPGKNNKQPCLLAVLCIKTLPYTVLCSARCSVSTTNLELQQPTLGSPGWRRSHGQEQRSYCMAMHPWVLLLLHSSHIACCDASAGSAGGGESSHGEGE